jgi:hypothetical protein
MSAVIVRPELIEGAATDLAAIGSALNAAHLTAAPATSAVLPAAADEISTRLAHLFSQHAQDYQRLADKATAFHDQFVQHLTASVSTYAGAEAANTAALQPSPRVANAVAAANIPLLDQFAHLVTGVILPVLVEGFLLAFVGAIFVAERLVGPGPTLLGLILLLAILGPPVALLGKLVTMLSSFVSPFVP